APSSRHVDICRPLVEAGIPVFVEKPAATSRESFDALAASAKSSGSPVMVGYHLRFHPSVKCLHRVMAGRRVGAVQSVEVAVHSHMPSWHGYEAPNTFYAGIKELGGGVVLTEIHEIDLLCWLFGAPESVMGFKADATRSDLDVEETVGAVMN